LFAIRCRINQVIQVTDISCIIVVTNTIYLVRHIFDSLTHPYQIQFIAIAQDLRSFFEKSVHNIIEFWNYPSNAKYIHYLIIDKETKKFNISPIFPCKLSWDLNVKDEYNSIIWNWQINFQASNFKEKYFLELLNINYFPIKPVYMKDGTYLKILCV